MMMLMLRYDDFRRDTPHADAFTLMPPG